MKVRDSQRSKRYEWERACVPLEQMTPLFNTAADAAEWANPIWRMERGRVGLAGKVAPNFEPGHGASGALLRMRITGFHSPGGREVSG